MTPRLVTLFWVAVFTVMIVGITNHAALPDRITVRLACYVLWGCYHYLRLRRPRLRCVALWLPALIMDKPEWIVTKGRE